MADATGDPQPIRYSLEVRCRAVALMETGVSPGGSGPDGRGEPGQRVSLVGALPGRGWVGCGSASQRRSGPRRLSAAAQATILAARGRAAELLHLASRNWVAFWHVGKRGHCDADQGSRRAG